MPVPDHVRTLLAPGADLIDEGLLPMSGVATGPEPHAGGLLVAPIRELAVVGVHELVLVHEGLCLEQPRAGVLHEPAAGAQVVNDLEGAPHDAVGQGEATGSSRGWAHGRFRGRVVSAREYSVQGGDAQMTSKSPGLKAAL